MIYSASANRKAQLRKLNKYIRSVNSTLAKDSLWEGRFFVWVHQIYWIDGVLCFTLGFHDKLTDKLKLVNMDSISCGDWKIFEILNEFIIFDCEVWQGESPYKMEHTWTNITNIKAVEKVRYLLPWTREFKERNMKQYREAVAAVESYKLPLNNAYFIADGMVYYSKAFEFLCKNSTMPVGEVTKIFGSSWALTKVENSWELFT